MEANSTISVWPIVIGGLTVIGVASYFVYLYMQNNTNHESDGTENDNATKDISLELKRIVKYFSGSMNALWSIAINPNLSLAKVTFNNIQQIVEIKGSDIQKKWYLNFGKDRNTWDIVLYKNKAKELINILMKCGIHPYEEEKLIWNNEYSKKYNKLSQVQAGQECMVVAPYWIYNGDIFEKGLVKAK